MELVKLSTGEAYTYEQIIADEAAEGRTLFPIANIAEADLSGFGVGKVEPTPAPEIEPGEVAERDGIEEYESGKWRWKWLVRARNAGEFTAHEASLHGLIDANAGAFRTRFITDVPGQQQTYAEKETEARAWSADPDGTYPFLAAEAAARSIPVADVAAEIIATADAWRGLGALIEAARIAGKRAVTAARVANDWAAMDAAAEIDWEALLA
jgi:hypothetical protein